MKLICIFIMILISSGAFAIDRNYECKGVKELDQSLPSSFYLQIEGKSVSLQDDADDIYYKGTLVRRIKNGNIIAKGFKGLLNSPRGMLLIGKGIFYGLSKSGIIIFDQSRDVISNKYVCENLD